jgi:hypothetical protein
MTAPLPKTDRAVLSKCIRTKREQDGRSYSRHRSIPKRGESASHHLYGAFLTKKPTISQGTKQHLGINWLMVSNRGLLMMRHLGVSARTSARG